MKKTVRMQDIADRLGISVAAVSKVLADKPGISDELRVKVRQTALEIGYRTSTAKKKAHRTATRSVAIIAAERLIRNGHERIAFVGTVRATSSIQDRYLGYMKSLMEHDIYIRKDYLIDDRDESGRITLGKLPEDMPTAFVCNCDETACVLIRKLRDMGVRVPEEVSITGFDNSVYSSLSDPKITTVEVNTELMSRLAVDSLLKKITKPGTVIGRIRVNGSIVYKNSVRAIKT